MLVVRRDIYSFYRLQRPTQTQELPQTSKMFDVSTDIEEIGRIKAEIMRILQNFLDESIDVCYIEDAANFREMLMIPSFLRRAQCLSNNDNLKGCSTSLLWPFLLPFSIPLSLRHRPVYLHCRRIDARKYPESAAISTNLSPKVT